MMKTGHGEEGTHVPSGVMDREILAKQQSAGNLNWWIAGRRDLFRTLIERLPVPDECRYLELGPGAASNLDILARRGTAEVFIADADVSALEICSASGYGRGVLVDAGQLPYKTASFDAVLAADVLEHVTNDKNALDEIARVLKPGGFAIVTVPAFASLWSEHDVRAGHVRRYRQTNLLKLVDLQSFEVEEVCYFNWIFFLPTLLIMKVMSLASPRTYADATSVPRWLNSALAIIFRWDIRFARKFRPPFGVSLLLVLKRS